MSALWSAEQFQSVFDVSRETIDRLAAYESLLRKWNARINLVSASSLDSIWQRHFADSAQLFALAGVKSGLWADLGSGAGFPGLVIAIMARESAPDLQTTLVESNLRKCAFLQSVATELAPGTTILSQRAEDLSPLNANIISARALAPLESLLPLAERHLAKTGKCLFLKGAQAESELTAARRIWDSSAETIPSVTDPKGVVLRIGDIHRA